MKRKIPISTIKSDKRPAKRSQGSVYSAVFHTFLPPRLFLHYCVLISFVASSGSDRLSMCEDQCLTWKRARENGASVLSRVLATPVCNSFPDSPQIKERSEYLLSVLYALSPFSLSIFPRDFHICLFCIQHPLN